MLGWALNLDYAGSAGQRVVTGDAQEWAVSDLPYFFDTGELATNGELATADLDTWLDLDMGFAETVTVSGTDIAGIFDDHSTSGFERDGPKVRLLTSDVEDNSIDQGTVLTIRTRTFHVRGVQRDGVGVSLVILEEPS